MRKKGILLLMIVILIMLIKGCSINRYSIGIEIGMKKKIKYIIIILIIIALIPIPHHIKDGGSVVYKALLYSVTKVHRISMSADNAYDVGWTIEILGKTVYDKTDIAYIKYED